MSLKLIAELSIIGYSDIFDSNFFKWRLAFIMPEISNAVFNESSITSKDKFYDRLIAYNHAINFAEKYNIEIKEQK